MEWSKFLHFELSPQVISTLSRQSFKRVVKFRVFFWAHPLKCSKYLLSSCHPNRLLETGTQAGTETGDFQKRNTWKGSFREKTEYAYTASGPMSSRMFPDQERSMWKRMKEQNYYGSNFKEWNSRQWSKSQLLPLSPTSYLSVFKAGNLPLSPSGYVQYLEPIVR